MRVAIVQETVSPGRGGAETSTVEMARCLAALDLDVTIVCRAEFDVPADDAVVDGIRYHRVDAVGTRLLRAIRFVRGADLFCRSEGFDIIHAVTPCLSANVYQPRGGTYVETVRRNIALERSPWAKLTKWIDRRLNWRQRFLVQLERTLLTSERRRPHIAAISEYVRRQVIEGFDYPEGLVHVVFNGVDITPLTGSPAAEARRGLRAQFDIPPDAPLGLFVAHNFKLKGLRELLIAFARLGGTGGSPTTDPDSKSPHLAIIGSGQRGPYERLARRLHIADRVHWIGSAPEMSAWYAAADLLAHPTWYDPCSRVVLEALACGVPVITTRHNGAAELLSEAGSVIDDPADTDALAAVLHRRLITEQAGRTSREASRTPFVASMQRHAEGLRALYARVTRPRSV